MEKILEYYVNLCYNDIRKRGGKHMYHAEMLLGQEYFSNKVSMRKVGSTHRLRELWRIFTLLKAIAKDSSFDKMIEDYIVKDKRIKSGTAIIKGTRISTQDIMHMLKDGYDVNEILQNFPSIQSKEQILVAMVYEIRSWKFIFTFLNDMRGYKRG